MADVLPGDYWLNVELLGINAAYHCFHVARRSSRKAKGLLTYEWGDLAPAMRRVSGTLVDAQPGTGSTPLWNIIHRVSVPISSATLRLQNAITPEAFSTKSDDRGEFAFNLIPNGTYVLHIEGGTTGRSYDSTDLLIKSQSDRKEKRSRVHKNRAGQYELRRCIACAVMEVGPLE